MYFDYSWLFPQDLTFEVEIESNGGKERVTVTEDLDILTLMVQYDRVELLM